MWLHVGSEPAPKARLDYRLTHPVVFRLRYRVGDSHLERVSDSSLSRSTDTECCIPYVLGRGQRTKKTAEVEQKLRKALGMDSQDGSIDVAEKQSSSAPRKADTRSSVDSYNNGEAGSGTSGSPGDRDSQRLLPEPIVASPEKVRTHNLEENRGEDYEMQEKRNSVSRENGL
jgi:hypothetical protein